MSKIVKTDAEWRAQLSPEAYAVTRQSATERPGSHNDFPNAPGTFLCTCCGAPLFDAGAKFESTCGWPSFDQPIATEAVEEKEDTSHSMRRTEIICSRCDAHLGHVFPDGPTDTGLRYCMNGVAMTFDRES